MDYHKDFIIDFARRTRANLAFIDSAEERGAKVYEVTQLANSLLGMLVFPREHYMRSVPETPLSELVQQGWPEIKTTHGSLPEENLKQLMRMLRNSIAHCNVEFLANAEHRIIGIKLWNKRGRETTWQAELSIHDLRTLAFKFIEMLEVDKGAE